MLLKWKANSKLVGEVTASQTALATGEVDILVGGGEWVTAGLAKENPALDFSIPKEGGILWSQSLAMFAASKNKDLALKFIQYILSPEGQARLATSSCYWGMPASQKAALTEQERENPALRRAEGISGARAALSRTRCRSRQENAGCVDGDAAGAIAADEGGPKDGRSALSFEALDFAGPATLWTVAFFVLPLAAMAVVSLWTLEGQSTDFSLANYRQFFANPSYYRAMINSLEVTAIVTVVSVLLAYPLAWILAEGVPERWQRLALILAILPFWTSYVVRSYSWLLVLAERGVVNNVLGRERAAQCAGAACQYAFCHDPGVRPFLRHAAHAHHLCEPQAAAAQAIGAPRPIWAPAAFKFSFTSSCP